MATVIKNRDLLVEAIRRQLSKLGIVVNLLHAPDTRAHLFDLSWPNETPLRSGVKLAWTHELVEVPWGVTPPDAVKLILVQLRLAGCSSISRLNA